MFTVLIDYFKVLLIDDANIVTLPVGFAEGFPKLTSIMLRGIRSFGESSLRFPVTNEPVYLSIGHEFTAITFAPDSISCTSSIRIFKTHKYVVCIIDNHV
jgi:hypothetical protein